MDERPLPAPRSRDETRLARAESYLLREDLSQEARSEDLHNLLATIRRRKWTIVAGTLSVFVAVAVGTFLIPEKYESTGTFLVERRSEREASAALDVLQRLGQSENIETETAIITSRRVIEPVVDDLGLHVWLETEEGPRRPGEFFSTFGADPDARPGIYRLVPDGNVVVVRNEESSEIVARGQPGSTVEFGGVTLALPALDGTRGVTLEVHSFDAAVEAVQGRIGAGVLDQETHLFSLTCEGGTAESAEALCSGIADQYLALRRKLQRDEAQQAATFLEEQVEDVQVRLAAAEDTLREYQRSNMAVALDARASQEVQNYAQLQAQREQIEAEREALASLIDAIEREGASPTEVRNLASFPTFLRSASGSVSGLLASLRELEDRRSEMAVTRTERNPDIVAIDERIAQIEGQLRSMASSYEGALADQAQALTTALGRTGGRVSALPAQQIETARLERQVTLLDELYRFLETRLREARIAAAVSMPGVQVVDLPNLPTAPSWPNVPLLLGLGLFLGLGFGMVLALYREHADTSLRDRAEIERETGLAVLGMIPRLRHPGPILPVSQNGEPARIGDGKDGRRKRRSVLPERHREEHFVAMEAFYSLSQDLRFIGHRMGHELGSLVMTSTSRGEGKTMITCNLALARASSVRTLLVDADFRGRGVARFFGIDPELPGLAEVLKDDAWPKDLIRRVTVDGREDLSILLSGETDEQAGRPSKILEGAALDSFLRWATGRFDFVLFDAPPLNVLTDSAILAARTDGVAVVVRGGMTDRAGLEITLERLERSGSSIVGVVLNDVELPDSYTRYSQQYASHSESAASD